MQPLAHLQVADAKTKIFQLNQSTYTTSPASDNHLHSRTTLPASSMLASHRTSHWQVYTRIMPELPSLASGSAYYGVGSPAGLRYHDKVLIPRSNPSSGSQNLENLNKEFQTSTPKCKRQLRFFARTQHKGGKFSSRTRPQETKPQKQTSRANLLIVILSCVQF